MLNAYPRNLARGHNFRAQAFCLSRRSASKVGPADPLWKAKIIFDARARTCLSADAFLLDHDAAQALGSCIYGTGQPGRASANDDQIIKGLHGLGCETRLAGQTTRIRIHQGFSIREENNRQAVSCIGKRLDHSESFQIILDIQPLIRNLVARQKILYMMACCRPLRARHANSIIGHRGIRHPIAEQVVEHGI